MNRNGMVIEKVLTSGTTGSPMAIPLEIEASFALLKRYHWTIGVPLKVRSVRFSGKPIVNRNASKPPFWVYNYLERQLFMSIYHLRNENFCFYIEKLNAFQPELIDGFPSAIYILAQFINKNKIKLSFT